MTSRPSSLPAIESIGKSPSSESVRHGYVHIPFCHRICPYCSFYKHTHGATDLNAFVSALLTEARLRAALHPCQFETLYFGGGTPTALSETHLDRLLSELREVFDLSQLLEWTVEANPRTVPASKAKLLKKHGVTRVSLGVQSWDFATLQTLGRDHSPEEALQTFAHLREAGFSSINIDLMFSIPGQSLDTWNDTVAQTIRLQPDHISAYNLNYEEDTDFFERLRRGQYREQPDTDAELFHAALDSLEREGYQHYEISNYARPGHESIHNAAYWFGKDYLAIGPGCTSTITGQRWQNVSDTSRYIASLSSGALPDSDHEILTDDHRRTERFGLELRTRQGLPLSVVAAAQLPLLYQLQSDGLLVIEEEKIRLTRLGKPLVDSIAVGLLG